MANHLNQVNITQHSEERQPQAEDAHQRTKAPLQHYKVTKRGLDVIVALAALPFTIPVGLAVSAGILVSSGRPIFYWHPRVGVGGRPFKLLKFRTMVPNADQLLKTDREFRELYESNFKLKHDPRVTRLGRLLRRTCLDELPQLYNVLRGDISLVGPRPIVDRELPKYGRHQKSLLSVPPGVTGLWQILRTNETSYPERVAMDMHYIQARSLKTDIQILLRTPLTLLRRRNGAC